MVVTAVVVALVACAPGPSASEVVPTAVPPPNSVGGPPDTTVPNVVAPGQSALEDAILECARKAAEARFTYQPVKNMKEGESEPVQAVATVGTLETPGSLAGGDPVVTTEVSLACTVEAALVGPDFEIEPEGWQVRSFYDTDEITWTWQVKPERSGSALPLSLRLRSFVELPGGAGRAIPIGPDDLTVSIAVDADPVTVGDRWRAFWSDPFWGSLGGVVILMSAATAAIRIMRKRWWWKSSESPASTADDQN